MMKTKKQLLRELSKYQKLFNVQSETIKTQNTLIRMLEERLKSFRFRIPKKITVMGQVYRIRLVKKVVIKGREPTSGKEFLGKVNYEDCTITLKHDVNMFKTLLN